MRSWDHDLNLPPNFSHTIHDALVDVEEERAREAQQAAARGLRTRGGPPQDVDPRDWARQKVRERHGPPGPGLTVRPEHLAECGAHVLGRIAVREDRVQIFSGGSTIKADCPNCGRAEQSWALLDLRGIGDPVRTRIEEADLWPDGAAGGAEPGRVPPYACHACWSAWMREGLFTHAELMESYGAPPELVQQVRADPNWNRRP